MFGAEWGYGEGLARRGDVVNLLNGRNFRVRSISTKSSTRSKVGFEGQSGSDSSLPTPPVLTPRRHRRFPLRASISAGHANPTLVLWFGDQRPWSGWPKGFPLGRRNESGLLRRSRASLGAERLADLLTLSYEAMLAWRLDGPIEFWNAGAEWLYGFAQNEAVGRSSHALLHTKVPIDFAELRSRLRNRQTWLGELRHTRKDGGEVIVESRMQLFGDGVVLEANRDVTARREIETALRETDQRLRSLASIVESSDDAIVSKSLDGIIASCEPFDWVDRVFLSKQRFKVQL
jgi:PAS domain S-box-containing protein